LTKAFSVFANGGERATPILIKMIVTKQDEVLEENHPYIELDEKEDEEEIPAPSSPVEKVRVISPPNAFIMTHLLQGVVQHGTGQGAKVLGRPIAGKTGTSSDYADAWFIGYTPSLLTTVWVGFDDKISLGDKETGARAALPIWISFMGSALRNTPIEEFKVPPGITMVKVNIDTGMPSDGSPEETILEAFAEGTAPAEQGEQGTEEVPPGTPSEGGRTEESSQPPDN
jgi:penicillin-binding protein 1A